MPILDPNTHQPVTRPAGATGSAVDKAFKDLRQATGLSGPVPEPDRAETATTNSLFGKQLNPIADKATKMYHEAFYTGVFSHMGVTPQEYDQAVKEMGATFSVVTLARRFMADAINKHQNARNKVAGLTMKLMRTRGAVLEHGLAPPETLVALTEAGVELDAETGDRQAWLQERRGEKAAMRETQATLEQSEATVADHEAQDEAQQAQKDLKLRAYSGEALRPDDLVVTPAAVTDRRGADSTEKRGTARPRSGRRALH